MAMGASDENQIVAHSIAANGYVDEISTPEAVDQKTTFEVIEHDHTEDVPKTHYSKLSIWLTILYSGLAIGSDG
jgi:hypothetical protein